MTISARTQLLGLIGWPVAHSFSPVMQNAAIAALGLDLAYLPLPVRPEDLPAAIQGLVALGFRGVNVTVPHKQAVMPLLNRIHPAAQAIGAVNTIVITKPSLLTGYNTDWSGFLADLQARQVEVAGRDCLILGAGGSARAVAYALGQAGAQVHIFARRPGQAQQIVDELKPHLPGTMMQAFSWVEAARQARQLSPALIVNTSPVGMHPRSEASPWPETASFPAGSFVYDLIYNPRETRFMRQAKATGCRTVNGLGMLVQQGARAFELWTGQTPDVAVMAAAISLDEDLGEQQGDKAL